MTAIFVDMVSKLCVRFTSVVMIPLGLRVTKEQIVRGDKMGDPKVHAKARAECEEKAKVIVSDLLDKYLNELSTDGSNQGSATCNFARAVYAESLRLIDELIAEYKTHPEQEKK